MSAPVNWFAAARAMVLMTENTVDAAKEKHVPVITKVAEGYKVAVGAVAAPHGRKTLDRVH
jgi:superoxide reductase